jgi:hypothetical protein
MEAHIKGHANDIPDDENGDEMLIDRSSNAVQQQPETKHSILLNTPSSSANSSPSNVGVNHTVVTKYETTEGSNMMNFAEQFTILNTASATSASNSNGMGSVYPDTPKDSEASSEQNSDGDDVTYMNMYSRFEQSVVNPYGVNSALLATLQPIAPTSSNSGSNGTAATTSTSSSNLITLKPIQQSANGSPSPMYDMNIGRNNGYFVQQSNDYK